MSLSPTSPAFTCRTMPKASSQPTNYALERAVNGLNACAAGAQAIIAPAGHPNGPRMPHIASWINCG